MKRTISSQQIKNKGEYEIKKKKINKGRVGGSESVKRLTLDFGSGHGAKVCGFEPHVRLSLSSSLRPSPLAHTLSL